MKKLISVIAASLLTPACAVDTAGDQSADLKGAAVAKTPFKGLVRVYKRTTTGQIEVSTGVVVKSNAILTDGTTAKNGVAWLARGLNTTIGVPVTNRATPHPLSDAEEATFRYDLGVLHLNFPVSLPDAQLPIITDTVPKLGTVVSGARNEFLVDDPIMAEGPQELTLLSSKTAVTATLNAALSDLDMGAPLVATQLVGNEHKATNVLVGIVKDARVEGEEAYMTATPAYLANENGWLDKVVDDAPALLGAASNPPVNFGGICKNSKVLEYFDGDDVKTMTCAGTCEVTTVAEKLTDSYDIQPVNMAVCVDD